MSGFDADWLALREPADAAARSEPVVQYLKCVRSGSTHIVDLGTGTGANLRWLAPRLGAEQHWLLIDDDTELLERAAPGGTAGVTGLIRTGDDSPRVSGVETLALNLATALGDVPWPRRGLVTASALLDLVSSAWLEKLAANCAGAAADVLFALTYDGRAELEPREPDDAQMLHWFNVHQRLDKGFGPALGPGAGTAATRAFAAAGYAVHSVTSDWQLDSRDAGLQRQLLAGWAAAAAKIAPEARGEIGDWLQRRSGHIDGGRSRILIGHVDIAGTLME